MDQVSEMLTMIRNAQAVLKQTVTVSFSNLKYEIAHILEKEGFVEKVEKKGKKAKKTIEIVLKYKDSRPAISGLKRISKPGQRVYSNYQRIKPIRNGYGIAIISTSRGLLTGSDAKRQRIGGEVVCEVW
jgi:small subunit ribosomal protein S8